MLLVDWVTLREIASFPMCEACFIGVQFLVRLRNHLDKQVSHLFLALDFQGPPPPAHSGLAKKKSKPCLFVTMCPKKKYQVQLRKQPNKQKNTGADRGARSRSRRDATARGIGLAAPPAPSARSAPGARRAPRARGRSAGTSGTNRRRGRPREPPSRLAWIGFGHFGLGEGPLEPQKACCCS